MREAIYFVYKGLAWTIFAAAVLQFFFAGLGAFEASAGFGPHRIVGLLLVPTSLLLLIVAGVAAATGSISRGRLGLAALLFALMFFQAFLVIAFYESAPTIAALHPVNGLLLLIVSYTLARGRRLGQMAEPGPAAATTSRVQ